MIVVMKEVYEHELLFKRMPFSNSPCSTLLVIATVFNQDCNKLAFHLYNVNVTKQPVGAIYIALKTELNARQSKTNPVI